MTNAELIERLKHFPQDLQVRVKYRDDGGDYYGEDNELILEIFESDYYTYGTKERVILL